MKFENAYSGVKKLFAGEILNIIAAVLLSCGLVFAVLIGAAAHADNLAAYLGAGLLGAGIPAVIIGIVAEIMIIVGLYQGSKDDRNYLYKAFWLSIIVLVLSIISGACGTTDSDPTLARTIFSMLSSIATLAVFNFTVEGYGQIANKLGDSNLLQRGRKLMMLLCVAIVCVIVATLVSNWVGITALVIAAILSVVVYIGYLVFLSAAKKSLSQA